MCAFTLLLRDGFWSCRFLIIAILGYQRLFNSFLSNKLVSR